MDHLNSPPPTEPAKLRGLRRMMKTAALLRANASDTDEAEVYLAEEKRFAKLLSKMQFAAEGALGDERVAA
jgi:hypothetical protein